MIRSTRVATAVALTFAFVANLGERASAQTAGADAGAPLQASNLLNPNISVVGELLAVAGNAPDLGDDAFQAREAELALQANVDPYSRADLFIAVTSDGVELEEATLTFLRLPADLQLKIGKFRSSAGKLNRIHVSETPFADRPLAATAFFGEEGLAASGASLSWLAPTDSFLELTAEVTTNWDEAPAFGARDPESGEIERGGERNDLGFLLRASTYRDLSESANVSLGLSALSGPIDPAGNDRTTAAVADFVFRWKPLDRASERSFVWQSEAIVAHSTRSSSDDPVEATLQGSRFGAYSWVDWQFARRWHVGLRGDFCERLTSDEHESGGLAFLTFAPSEFSRVSLQGRWVRSAEGENDTAAFLKVTFNIGPHGAHPF